MASSRPLLSTVHFLLPEVITTLLVAFSPSVIWRISGVIVVSSFYVAALMSTTGDGYQDYSVGSAIGADFLTGIGLIWLIDPIREYRYEKDTAQPDDQAWPKRMYWAFCARRNPRGIGWNYQVSNIPLPPTDPRWSFVRRYALRAICLFILADIAETYLSYFPLFSQADAHPVSNPLLGQILDGISFVAQGARVFAMLSMPQAVSGAISVAVGLSEPRYWPKVFGHWSDAYTVRRFWGRTWHQMMRRVVTIYGKSSARFLGFQSGSTGSSYTQLYVGFIVSGIAHCGGDLMVDKKYAGLSFPFFFAQAVAITFEDAVLALAEKSGIPVSNTLARLVGCSWVVFWFNLSLPWFLRWPVDAGIIQPSALPFSPISAVVRSFEKGLVQA